MHASSRTFCLELSGAFPCTPSRPRSVFSAGASAVAETADGNEIFEYIIFVMMKSNSSDVCMHALDVTRDRPLIGGPCNPELAHIRIGSFTGQLNVPLIYRESKNESDMTCLSIGGYKSTLSAGKFEDDYDNQTINNDEASIELPICFDFQECSAIDL